MEKCTQKTKSSSDLSHFRWFLCCLSTNLTNLFAYISWMTYYKLASGNYPSMHTHISIQFSFKYVVQSALLLCIFQIIFHRTLIHITAYKMHPSAHLKRVPKQIVHRLQSVAAHMHSFHSQQFINYIMPSPLFSISIFRFA